MAYADPIMQRFADHSALLTAKDAFAEVRAERR